MHSPEDLQILVNQIQDPAFLVRDSRIITANPGATARGAQPNTPLTDIWVTGQEEYNTMSGGSLHLTVCFSGTQYCCTITKLSQGDLFVLNEPLSGNDLQALSLAAEQLRQPLSEMSIALEAMDATENEQRAKLTRSIYQLHRIIGNMSDTARIIDNAGRLHPCDLREVLSELLEKAAALLEKSGFHLQYTLPTECIYTVADRELLSRAVYNLLSNASKFSAAGCTITVSVRRKANKLYLTVGNHGQQLSAKVLGTMFHRYKRIPSIEDPRFGIGLGMKLIQTAASVHGGTVLVENMQDNGVQVTMSMVIRRSNDLSVRSPILKPDLYGGKDQALVELSEVLDSSLYQ